MNRKNKELYNLAAAMKVKQAVTMCWAETLDRHFLGIEVYELALRISQQDSLRDDQIMTVFFTPSACVLLFSLPNQYWFWRIVERAALLWEDEDQISDANVRQAIAEERSNLRRTYPFATPVSEMSQVEIALRVAAGLLLVKAGSLDKAEIVRNSIFSP